MAIQRPRECCRLETGEGLISPSRNFEIPLPAQSMATVIKQLNMALCCRPQTFVSCQKVILKIIDILDILMTSYRTNLINTSSWIKAAKVFWNFDIIHVKKSVKTIKVSHTTESTVLLDLDQKQCDVCTRITLNCQQYQGFLVNNCWY